MAYDEYLADRLRQKINQLRISAQEKKMMGGLCFLVEDKMCFGIVKNDLMARIGPDDYEKALQKPGIRPMDFTKKPLKGYVFVSPLAIDQEEDLEYWIQKCLEFNPKAKSSKKKQ
ncbi:TfoX/Sxy family protein [Persicobacter diffluens]|uniref:TfoX N-terminal domain-containing protein n=1 Tax=Persicobacter diffluens TaxID=981 RepID=A0AAN4VZI1_9BACT|nr:hypothetical protein PEDI_31700 [Persicobacter diffluens]